MRSVFLTSLAVVMCAVSTASALDLKSLEGEDWHGLYMTGKKVGYSMSRVEVGPEGKVTVIEDASFKLNMAGIKQDMRIYSKRIYSPDGALASIESKVDDIAGTSEFQAVVQGDKMVLESRVGGQRTVREFPRPTETIGDMLKYMELLQGDPKAGKSISFSVFEPMYQSEISGTSTLVGTEERVLDGISTTVFKVETKMAKMNIDSMSYVLEDGTTLEDKVAGGIITMRLEPKEVAKDVQYTNDTIISNAAMLDRAIANPRNRAELKLRIEGPLQHEELFNDDRQSLERRVDSFTFIGRKESLEGFTPAALPIQEASVQEWQEPSLFVQSDHPRMIATAESIVGEEADAKVVSDKLVHWVYQNVRSTFSARLTNSLEVLDNREGDCTEHSMLYIGLARAAGLPAREVAGLIYVDSPRPGFYFHQWAKVWIGKWIEVDPTFDQPVADATHIKLAEGDLFEQTKILPVIGQLKIAQME
jgi:Transglutaminase-like superfamily